ncbi:hypothetical protein HDU67_007576 [Dinochytrium kinnereticum]|nr:hypothetical protein HDU67_007576 [Dinochytrium kinnereticum]
MTERDGPNGIDDEADETIKPSEKRIKKEPRLLLDSHNPSPCPQSSLLDLPNEVIKWIASFLHPNTIPTLSTLSRLSRHRFKPIHQSVSFAKANLRAVRSWMRHPPPIHPMGVGEFCFKFPEESAGVLSVIEALRGVKWRRLGVYYGAALILLRGGLCEDTMEILDPGFVGLCTSKGVTDSEAEEDTGWIGQAVILASRIHRTPAVRSSPGTPCILLTDSSFTMRWLSSLNAATTLREVIASSGLIESGNDGGKALATVLGWAARWGAGLVVRVLVEAGADPSFDDNS